MKTREDVEALKANWVKDPIYDLASVEGFEEYHSELDQFQDEMEAKWKANAEAKHPVSFEDKKQVIEDELDALDAFITDLPLDANYYHLRIATEQVFATLLLAEQIKRVGDLLEEAHSYDKYIRGN